MVFKSSKQTNIQAKMKTDKITKCIFGGLNLLKDKIEFKNK